MGMGRDFGPGGRLEEDENILQAIIREAQEETGITVAPRRVVVIEDLLTSRYKMIKVWMVCDFVAGEVHPTRPYFKAIPAAWKLGTNPAFDSAVIDQAQPAWAEFFCETIVRPLWERGFRGFFLDTLDSYHLVAKTDAERARQEAGLASVITLLKQKFPDAKLMFNRGFEILPKVHGLAYAVAAESLYRSYDHGAKATVRQETWVKDFNKDGRVAHQEVQTTSHVDIPKSRGSFMARAAAGLVAGALVVVAGCLLPGIGGVLAACLIWGGRSMTWASPGAW